ncbi:uncharacterized protein LOC128953520 [Oppia nitens]|uniref:uncharacterized protein LOC128953520 n=1 Tax=Oppia nitens TaxID=1686743 RepID=UPI0023DB6B78|nr:uncharacterized protein LOC128953520 [Oppia nitens]
MSSMKISFYLSEITNNYLNIHCLIAIVLWTVILIVGDRTSLVVAGGGIDFCDKYKANDYKISFAYGVYNHNLTDKELDDKWMKYLIVDKYYWRLKFTDGPEANKSVEFVDSVGGGGSESSIINEKTYELIWNVWFASGDTGRLKGHDYAYHRFGGRERGLTWINWYQLDNNLAFIAITQNSMYNLTVADFKPQFAWVSTVRKGRESRFVTFWDNFTTNVYNFTDPQFMQLVKRTNSSEDEPILFGDNERSLDKSLNIIGIIGQYSLADNDGLNKSFCGHGSIVFMNFGESIKYCYVGNPFISDSCKPENLKTLITCSTPTLPTSAPPLPVVSITESITDSTTAKPDDDGPNWLLILILIIVAVVILLILLGLALCCCLRGKSGQKVDANKADVMSSMPSQASGVMSTRSGFGSPDGSGKQQSMVSSNMDNMSIRSGVQSPGSSSSGKQQSMVSSNMDNASIRSGVQSPGSSSRQSAAGGSPTSTADNANMRSNFGDGVGSPKQSPLANASTFSNLDDTNIRSANVQSSAADPKSSLLAANNQSTVGPSAAAAASNVSANVDLRSSMQTSGAKQSQQPMTSPSMVSQASMRSGV